MNEENKNLAWDEKGFTLDGRPFRVLSGAIHYFRVPPEYWADRLRKLRACGFNTVETVCCWNLHERKAGRFDFSGMLDLAEFIRTADEEGLYVILRPGPYICAEWDLGCLPSWLLKNRSMRLRCRDQAFLEKAKNYLREIFDRVRPYLYANGGNVLAMQVENEYGSYGNDHEYMKELLDFFRGEKMDCLFFTSDGPTFHMLKGGSIDGLLSAVNFGSDPEGAFALKKRVHPDQPLFCAEYWNGWFDHWGEAHHTREADDTADVLRRILRMGASVNLYMFHGGTSFGLHSGANHEDGYQPDVTSYDYNAPLSENGDMTPKYEAIRRAVLEEMPREYWRSMFRERRPSSLSDAYTGGDLPGDFAAQREQGNGTQRAVSVTNLPRKTYGTVRLNRRAALVDNLQALGKPVRSSPPLTMEEAGLDFGFALYRTRLEGPMETLEMSADGLHDRADIYINGSFAGTKERNRRADDTIKLGLDFGESAQIDIFVENRGRVNYGEHLWDEKGITGGVRLGRPYLYGWEMYCLKDEIPEGLSWQDADASPVRPEDQARLRPRSTDSQAGQQTHSRDIPAIQQPCSAGPCFYRGELKISGRADTFLRAEGFVRGCVFVNGFCLGRYDNEAGPQKALYLPAPLLKEGRNTITVFELTDVTEKEKQVYLGDTPELG